MSRTYDISITDAGLWFGAIMAVCGAAGLALLAPGFLLITMHGVGSVALQLISPSEYRARITALYFFVVNLIGLGLGPTAIALVTDVGFGDDAALRYSLVVVSGTALPLAALLLTLGMPAYRRSVSQTEVRLQNMYWLEMAIALAEQAGNVWRFVRGSLQTYVSKL